MRAHGAELRLVNCRCEIRSHSAKHSRRARTIIWTSCEVEQTTSASLRSGLVWRTCAGCVYVAVCVLVLVLLSSLLWRKLPKTVIFVAACSAHFEAVNSQARVRDPREKISYNCFKAAPREERAAAAAHKH